jgi:hypothetical protein
VIDVKKDIALINIDLEDEDSNGDQLSSKKGSLGESHVFLDNKGKLNNLILV